MTLYNNILYLEHEKYTTKKVYYSNLSVEMSIPNEHTVTLKRTVGTFEIHHSLHSLH